LTLLMLTAQESPPPLGQLVDVGGYRVHLYCTGQGSPTVVAIGGFSMDWALVQSEVAQFTRICTYDVSGTAWSEPGRHATCPDRYRELHAALHNAGIEGPYLFAGLSVGALVSRYYAIQYPGEVVALVFVDHAFTPGKAPSGPVRPPDANGDSPPQLIEQPPIDFTVEEASDFNNLPEKMRELHRWAASKPPVSSVEAADDCTARLKSVSLGSLPLVVISTGNQARGYAELQARLLALSRNSRQVMALRSLHSVEIDQPEVVVDAIRQAMGMFKSGTKQ